MEMTLKDYEINKSKILEFLHGLKCTGPEFVQLLQVSVPEITFLVFNYIFFRLSDFKFSTQFVSTLIVAAFILFQVSWPRYRSILLQWCRDSIFNISICKRPITAVQFGNSWVKKILTTAKIESGRMPGPIWLSDFEIWLPVCIFR